MLYIVKIRSTYNYITAQRRPHTQRFCHRSINISMHGLCPQIYPKFFHFFDRCITLTKFFPLFFVCYSCEDYKFMKLTLLQPVFHFIISLGPNEIFRQSRNFYWQYLVYNNICIQTKLFVVKNCLFHSIKEQAFSALTPPFVYAIQDQEPVVRPQRYYK